MKNINYARIILLLAAIITATIANYYSSQVIIDTTYKTLDSVNHTVASGISNGAIGFCVISASCFLGFAITYLRKED